MEKEEEETRDTYAYTKGARSLSAPTEKNKNERGKVTDYIGLDAE